MDYIDLSIRDFSQHLADSTTGPGGGSAAAVMGLIGISLLEMATGGHDRMHVLPELQALHQWLLRLVDQDSAAFAAVLAAQEQQGDKVTETLAGKKLEDAVCGAIEVPLTIASSCLQALTLANNSISVIASAMVSEVAGASASLVAGIQGATASAYANFPLLVDQEKRADYSEQIAKLEEQGRLLAAQLQERYLQRQE